MVAALLLVGGTSLAVPAASTSAAASPSPAFIPAAADWLTSVNYYRAMSGLSPLTENASWSVGAQQHSCYMLANGMSHDEVPGATGYTTAGDESGNNSNVAVSSSPSATVRSFVELWMTGPYHAIGVLRPELRTTGFGRCERTDTPTWHSGATLDVIHGLGVRSGRPNPILFPGDGMTTSLSKFVVETPNPLDACGWTGAAGLPVLAMMPESPAGATASISGPNGPLETCTVSGANTNGVAKQLLDGDNVVVAIPRAPLVEGVYHVTIRTNARTVAWTFTVDKSAADGKVTASQPVDAALTTSGASTMQPVAPARVVDTRISRGAVPFDAGTQQRIQITGTGGVPAGATAVVANITATEGAADGFVTLWNCAGGPPNASTLNFHAGQNVPNSATIPLDASGGLCAFAYAPTQLIVDVTGYDAPGAPGRYNPVTPTRIMDSRLPLGPSSRLDAGQTAELHVAGTAGLPVNPTAVVLNVTAADASELGFVTVYPCGTRPETSNLNPTVGDNRANLVTTTLSASGNVCLFTLKPTDLVVDVVGYFATTGRQLAVTTPFRFTDTRETNPQLNAERNGRQLAAGVVTEIPMAGVRGISAGATAVSVNITAVNATSSGWIAAWPCTGSTPTTSNVNYGPSSPVANAAQLTLSSRGSICVVSYTDVDLIIDVNGWWA